MRQFILGTDWWTDCDDAVAVRVLARAHQKKNINLLGIVVNACMPTSIPSIDVFLQKEGIENLPLGLDTNGTDFTGRLTPYQDRLSQRGAGRKNEDALDGVRLYRKLLSESTEKVDIVEIGFLQVVAALLQSKPDDLSPLDGIELVRQKVAHFWVMAGKWDEEEGIEHNFCNNPRSRIGADIFCRLCPVPVTFLGFEIGLNVISGKHLQEDDNLGQTMADWGTRCGRCSWDPMTALLALEGDAEKAGYSEVFGQASVDPNNGKNRFYPGKGLHSYVVMKYPTSTYEKILEDFIS